jgi:hypothetical protein
VVGEDVVLDDVAVRRLGDDQTALLVVVHRVVDDQAVVAARAAVAVVEVDAVAAVEVVEEVVGDVGALGGLAVDPVVVLIPGARVVDAVADHMQLGDDVRADEDRLGRPAGAVVLDLEPGQLDVGAAVDADRRARDARGALEGQPAEAEVVRVLEG